jgi:beta-phosphoglucomutase-like phosphatase (HAD superfamily)
LQPSITASVPAEYISCDTAHGRVAWRSGLRWDTYDAYLFDIDGTLLRDPGRVHYHAFSKACVEVLGHPLSLEPISVQGSTDPRILRDAFAAAGIADATWRPHQATLLKTICSVVERDASGMQLKIMPGVGQPKLLARSLAATHRWSWWATRHRTSPPRTPTTFR